LAAKTYTTAKVQMARLNEAHVHKKYGDKTGQQNVVDKELRDKSHENGREAANANRIHT
jgi:hypothetical protein